VFQVHGRTREQKGHTQGHANWEAIREIRRHVRGIPIIANGSVETFDDISHALSITGTQQQRKLKQQQQQQQQLTCCLECEAVMSASGILRNPALFSGKSLSPFEMIREYLNLTEVYPTPRRYIINHIYSILHD
jgi:tRNA-dihydrouridine synthase